MKTNSLANSDKVNLSLMRVTLKEAMARKKEANVKWWMECKNVGPTRDQHLKQCAKEWEKPKEVNKQPLYFKSGHYNRKNMRINS